MKFNHFIQIKGIVKFCWTCDDLIIIIYDLLGGRIVMVVFALLFNSGLPAVLDVLLGTFLWTSVPADGC